MTFIQFVDKRGGESVTKYLNLNRVSEATYSEDGTLVLTIGDQNGKCEEKYLTGAEAQRALEIIRRQAK